MERESIVRNLKKYYTHEQIVPGEKFNCKNKEKCKVTSNDLAAGMQCHVGTKYGESKYKVLVVSLDCGDGCADDIDTRTEVIEKCSLSNLHMKGTGKIISDFYEMTSIEALKYYAMTNSCKCSRKKSTNQQQYDLHFNCLEYKIKEIELLNPDVIYFQGINSLAGIENKLQQIEDIPQELSSRIKQIEINGKKYPAVICIHPSARGRHRKAVNQFYDITIKEINKYIKESLIIR